MANATQQIQELMQEVRHLAEIVELNARESSANGLDLPHINTRELKRAARKAGKEVRHYIEDKQKRMSDIMSKCEETIAARPYTATAVAVVAGVMLGSLLRRR